MNSNNSLLGFDYGDARVGVARAGAVAKLPEPLIVLVNNDNMLDQIAELISQHGADELVVGLPRNMDGSLGDQAKKCQAFATMLHDHFVLPVSLVEEGLSSVAADAKSTKAEVGQDALAAAEILERYFQEGAISKL